MLKNAALTFSVMLFFHSSSLLAAEALKNPQELYDNSDLVILGETAQIEQTMDETTCQIRIEQFLKGHTDQHHISVVAQGGKALQAPNQPTFSNLQKSILFLKREEDHYVCLKGSEGQKLIFNDNVYPYTGNIMYSVPLKTYLKSLPQEKKTQ